MYLFQDIKGWSSSTAARSPDKGFSEFRVFFVLLGLLQNVRELNFVFHLYLKYDHQMFSL